MQRRRASGEVTSGQRASGGACLLVGGTQLPYEEAYQWGGDCTGVIVYR